MIYDKEIYDEYGIYIKPQQYSMSTRKLDAFKEIAKMQKYYQCNPVRFNKDFFNIDLLDGQALTLELMWITQNVLVVATRGYGKSTIIDIFTMDKTMLFSNYWTYIASGSGGQAEQTFTTLEKIANDNIDTFNNSTGSIFKNEVEINNASGDGFTHSTGAFKFSLYNGSFCQTVNSNTDRQRGKRGNVIFDESGFLSSELMNVYAAFAVVNKSFKTGTDAQGRSIDPILQRAYPTEIPNQKIYVSSASSTDTQFYNLYRLFSKKQIMGDRDYCVLHIDCEQAFHPTLHGEVIAPLLSRSVVESEMRTNPEKARREYYCEFTTDAGTDAIIRRGVITRNEETRKPLLYNDTGKKKFVIAYDPARSMDNSIILVMEIYEAQLGNGKTDLRGRIVNCINLMDIEKKTKTPMRTPEQIEYLKKVILDYNAGADGYGNILGVFIDAGAGGGGVNIADYLMPDWTDKGGNKHRGLIDKEYSAEYVGRFPNAVDKIRLISPQKLKSTIYEALIELTTQDKISFTSPYDGKGYLTIFDIDEKKLNKAKASITKKLEKMDLTEEEFDEKFQEELNKIQSVNTRIEKLTWEDELALNNIDAMKEEMCSMVRKKRDSGKDSFELTPEKAGKLHDDRSYTCALLAYALMEERRKKYMNEKQKPKTSIANALPIRSFKRVSDF